MQSWQCQSYEGTSEGSSEKKSLNDGLCQVNWKTGHHWSSLTDSSSLGDPGRDQSGKKWDFVYNPTSIPSDAEDVMCTVSSSTLTHPPCSFLVSSDWRRNSSLASSEPSWQTFELTHHGRNACSLFLSNIYYFRLTAGIRRWLHTVHVLNINFPTIKSRDIWV